MNQGHKYVAVSYTIFADASEGKQVVEQVTAQQPIQFVTGFGLVNAEFEQAVLARQEGETFSLTIPGITADNKQIDLAVDGQVIVTRDATADEIAKVEAALAGGCGCGGGCSGCGGGDCGAGGCGGCGGQCSE